MQKQDFEKLYQELTKKGYKKYIQSWHHEDYVLGKSFHKKENIYEEDRPAYQILISVYDYTLHPEFHTRLEESERQRVGMEVRVMASRTVNERLELSMAFDNDMSIEKLEETAELFYHMVCTVYPEPKGIGKC